MSGLYVRQLELGPMQNFVYLFGAEDAREVAVVDPAWDVDAVCAAVREDDKQLVAAFLTHHHFDHINGLGPLLGSEPDLRVYAQQAELDFSAELQSFGDRVTVVEPGGRVAVGPLGVECLHTPGHTPGSQCLHTCGSVFTGDTLFVCGCGRCDLAGGDPQQMFDSLHRVLGSLPDETLVYPGHDYGDVPVSTIGGEKANNPYFQRGDRDSFHAYRMRPR